MAQLKFDLFLRKTDVLSKQQLVFYLMKLFRIYRAIGIDVCFEVHIPVKYFYPHCDKPDNTFMCREKKIKFVSTLLRMTQRWCSSA